MNAKSPWVILFFSFGLLVTSGCNKKSTAFSGISGQQSEDPRFGSNSGPNSNGSLDDPQGGSSLFDDDDGGGIDIGGNSAGNSGGGGSDGGFGSNPGGSSSGGESGGGGSSSSGGEGAGGEDGDTALGEGSGFKCRMPANPEDEQRYFEADITYSPKVRKDYEAGNFNVTLTIYDINPTFRLFECDFNIRTFDCASRGTFTSGTMRAVYNTDSDIPELELDYPTGVIGFRKATGSAVYDGDYIEELNISGEETFPVLEYSLAPRISKLYTGSGTYRSLCEEN